MTSIVENQKERLLAQIKSAGSRGRTRKSLCYLERRHQELGDELTVLTLDELVSAGEVRMEITGPKKFKTESDKEKKRGYVYYAI